MNKVILVLSDALRYDTAIANMGYLGHMVEYKKASLYKIVGELPSMSRPMYETIHTGMPSSETGIVANSIVRLSEKPNIFKSVREAGKVTAAAAYYWYSELYNRASYNPIDDREVDDASLNIQHGRFYTTDEYPDIELFNTAGHLVRKYSPDYLLLHPMGMDYHGGNVEILGEIPAQRGTVALCVGHRQHVAVAFLPRRVGDFGDDGVQRDAVIRIAVIEAHRIEAVAEIAQVRKHADRTFRSAPGCFAHARTHGVDKWHGWIAQIIVAAELREIAPVHRPQPAPDEHAIEFGQVQVQHVHLVAERMRMRCMTAVAHPAFVDATGQWCVHGQRTPRPLATSVALRMPSSWKPQPQYAPANQVRFLP